MILSFPAGFYVAERRQEAIKAEVAAAQEADRQAMAVALSEAHERAVVTGVDRQNFWQLVESSLVEERMPTLDSAKSRSKRTKWV